MIYLAQTDTTAGFLSKDLRALNELKKRPLNQPCLITTAKFGELKSLVRVPRKFKNLVRKAKKTTFIYPKNKQSQILNLAKISINENKPKVKNLNLSQGLTQNKISKKDLAHNAQSAQNSSQSLNSLAIRVVKDCKHTKFLEKEGFFYSTSANLHGEKFDEAWAKSVADIIVDESFSQNKASKLIKLSRLKARKMR